MSNFQSIIDFIRNTFQNYEGFIPLHAPVFSGNEKKYLLETIDSTFVSSVGVFVDKSEAMMSQITGTKKSVAVVNGTAGLHIALKLSGVKSGDEVITQALTFVATANAISYIQAEPTFLDVDIDTMGLSPTAVSSFLEEFAEMREGSCYNKRTNKKIAACVPMHTFGFPVHMNELLNVCNKWNIPVIEDAAESLGSYYQGKHTGSFGQIGVFSFNGNKIVTSGGGGMLVTNSEELGIRGKHITTTAKVPHAYEFMHDQIGFNYRMPNVNAALLCAQLEQLDTFLQQKRILALQYASFFKEKGIQFRLENPGTKVNYWLMCIELENKAERELLLKESNATQVMMRPIWQLMTALPMYKDCQKDDQINASYLVDRIVNIPSSAI